MTMIQMCHTGLLLLAASSSHGGPVSIHLLVCQATILNLIAARRDHTML